MISIYWNFYLHLDTHFWYNCYMSFSNYRNTSPRTYHHLISRIAHKVYFMTDEVRNDFIEMVRRTADYCGIQLVAWCIMSNHFHILAYLPDSEQLDKRKSCAVMAF